MSNGNVYTNEDQLNFTGHGVLVNGSGVFFDSPATTLSGNDVTVFVGGNRSFETEKQKFAPSNRVELYELDCTALGGDLLRFSPSARENDPIYFGGHEYTAIPIEAEGFETSGKGTLPTPTLRMMNTASVQSLIIGYDDLIGAVLYRIRTFRTFLDDGASPDFNAKFPIDVYKIDRKAAQNKVFVEFELAASIDQEGRMIPGRQILKDYCTHIYRRYDSTTGDFDYTEATCPYVGTSYFDVNNNSTTKENDRCGKKLSSCRARFGQNGILPTRAFPGVARIR